MFIDDEVRLFHMREASREALSFVQNRTGNNLDNNRMLTLSVVRCVEIIGEADSRVSKARQNELKNIP